MEPHPNRPNAEGSLNSPEFILIDSIMNELPEHRMEALLDYIEQAASRIFGEDDDEEDRPRITHAR